MLLEQVRLAWRGPFKVSHADLQEVYSDTNTQEQSYTVAIVLASIWLF